MTPEADRLARVGLARAVGPGVGRREAQARGQGVVAVWDEVRKDHPDVVPERDLDLADRGGTRVVCPGDPEWPPGLAALAQARQGPDDAGEPWALWVRGSMSLVTACEQAVAVVGARAASGYGTHVAAELGASLAERGWTVVSGAAFGIDAAAHRGALVSGGLTVAVLAGGVDVPYPRAHAPLLERIAADGLIVSESPPGSPPYRRSFLFRNRVIAALSGGTVLVEAGLRSGALNTARHARRLGKPLMVVPGPVTSATSAGCNQLLRTLREEVAAVTCAADILEEVGPVGTLSDRPKVPPGPRDGLSELMVRVLDAIPARGAVGPAVIARAVGQRPDIVLAILGPLAAEGLVERCADGYRLTALGRAPAATPKPPARPR